MSNSLCNATLAEIKRDITAGLLECSRRGLVHSVKWYKSLCFLSHMLVVYSA